MSNKTVFELSVKEGLTEKTKESETANVVSEFREFIDRDIPKEVTAYVWEDNEVLIQVFKYKPKSEINIHVNQKGLTSDDNKVRYFSFAKVLASGPTSRYKAGDLVKLRDIDTLTIESSAYKNWVDNPMSKSNLKQQGTEPQQYVSNIFKTFGTYVFILNPSDLKKLDSNLDEAIYKVSDPKIENIIKDVDLLLNID